MLKHDPEFYDFKMNKMSDKWLLAFKDVTCDKKDINCKESYKRTVRNFNLKEISFTFLGTAATNGKCP